MIKLSVFSKKETKEMIGLGFIALLGLTVLFLIAQMTQADSTGNFVYAGGRVQLDTKEVCASMTNCKTGPAVFVSSIGWQYKQHPGQYALCICPEDVHKWYNNMPYTYDKSKTRIIAFVQNYEGGMNLGYD